MESKAETKAEELGRDARAATSRASSDIREFGRDVRDSAKEGLHEAEDELKKGAKNASKGAEATAGRISDAAKDAKSSILGTGNNPAQVRYLNGTLGGSVAEVLKLGGQLDALVPLHPMT